MTPPAAAGSRHERCSPGTTTSSSPDPTAEGGMGRYLVHQVGDLVQTRTGPGGTTVRTVTWRPDEDPAGRPPAA